MTYHVRSDGSTVMATLPTAGTSGGFQTLLLLERPGCRDTPAALITPDAPPGAAAAAVLPGGPSPLLQSGSLTCAAPPAGLRPAAAGSAAALGRCRSGVMSALCLCRCGCTHISDSTANTTADATIKCTGYGCKLAVRIFRAVMSAAVGAAPCWAHWHCSKPYQT